MPAEMSAERKAEIRRIMSCVPFIEPDAGVIETQQAICDLLDYVEELEGRTPPAPPDPVRARLVEAAKHMDGVLESHETESFDCDGCDRYCDCLSRARDKLKAALAAAEGESNK